MKRTIAALVLTAIVAVTPAFADSSQKIGVVDLQRAVSETKEGVAARADIFKKTEQLNNELKSIQGDFEKLKAELEKEGTGMKAEARAEKESRLQQKSRDFQKRQRDAQDEIKQMEADLLQKMINRLSLLMGKIGDEGNYAVIIEQSVGMRYYNKNVDITPLLIKKADETYGK
ncbi:MAG: OmpH family outer membrane protein [Desulfuromonadales bacterium]